MYTTLSAPTTRYVSQGSSGPSATWSLSSPDAQASIAYESPVMSPRQWHQQHVAEAGANLEPDHPHYPLCKCYLCGVMIGPGYLAYELYLCHIKEQKVYDSSDGHIYIEDAWIETCHSCAHRKQRESMFVFGVQHIEPRDYEALRHVVQLRLFLIRLSLYKVPPLLQCALLLRVLAASSSLHQRSLPKTRAIPTSPISSSGTPSASQKLSLRGYGVQPRSSLSSATIAS